MKLDPHVHSMFSYDSRTLPERVVRKAVRLGLDGIVITEHNSYSASAAWEDVERGELLILRAVEYNAREGHLLIYGIASDEYISEIRKPLTEIIRIANGEGWALVAPHPFKDAEIALGEALSGAPGVDAIELNSYCTDEENQRAIAGASRLGLPLIGGSDAHVHNRIGRFHTVFESEIRNMEQLVTELKGGNYRPVRLLPNPEGEYCIPEMVR